MNLSNKFFGKFFGKKIHLVGFGGQGANWAKCLRLSGWEVIVYLPENGKSFQLAFDDGFSPVSVENLRNLPTGETHWIAMLCPDSVIASVYDTYLSHLESPLRLVLAHGFAVYSKDLKPKNPNHKAVLLAPKAIGPKILQNYQNYSPSPHPLVAAVSEAPEAGLIQLAQGLGFSESSLVETTLEMETVGDLISEQGLLCGGVFNLLEWTLEAMQKAGVPEALIREECLSELELIAGLIRERGISKTFLTISQVAQAGTIGMRERFEDSGFKKHFVAQLDSITQGDFTRYYQTSDWKTKAIRFSERLKNWDNQLSGNRANKGEL